MERSNKNNADKILNENIFRLILVLSIPAIISNLISNIYNLVDTYFVGTLGVSASGAVGIVFTLMAILQAVAFMLGQGAGTNISRRLAVNEIIDASEFASVSFYLSIFIGLLFTFFGLIFLTPLMMLLGSTSTILPYSKIYGMYILISAPALMGSLVLNNIFRYEGKTYLGMIGLSIGGILNMIGDPILINTFDLGIHGAGLSTMISQYISFIILIILFKYKSACTLSLKSLKNGFNKTFLICHNGLPSLIRQGLNSFSSGILNNCAKIYGDDCISAMSIVSRCQAFMVSVALGLGQGFQPVAGFNYQVKNYSRLKKATTYTLVLSTVIFIVLAIPCAIFSPNIINLFIDNQNVIEIGKNALIYTAIGIIFLPLSTVTNMLYQSTGQSLIASILASFRSGLILIPVILILSSTLNLLGIQLSTSVSDVISSIVSLPFLLHFYFKYPSMDYNER